jgi:hypothetical protein
VDVHGLTSFAEDGDPALTDVSTLTADSEAQINFVDPTTYADVLDGWYVECKWSYTDEDGNSKTSTSYEHEAVESGSYYVSMYARYSVNNASRNYSKGEFELTIPGIGNAVRTAAAEGPQMASLVIGSAEKVDSLEDPVTSSQDWVYEWDSTADEYRFVNNFDLPKR